MRKPLWGKDDDSVRRIEVDGAGRHYEHPTTGHKMPSVTNVLSVIAKPALVHWAAKVERELCVRTANAVYQSLGSEHVDHEEFAKRLEFALPRAKAHKSVVGEAINIGNEAHALIEWRIRGELGLERGDEPECSEPALWAVAGFEDWRRKYNFKPTHTEERLWSDELDAGGSTDALCCELDVYVLAPLPRRVSAVVDWKSSKALYPEMEIQVAAYRHMAIERGILDENSWALILRLPKTIRDPEFEGRPLPPSHCRKLVEVFKACRRIWEWQHA